MLPFGRLLSEDERMKVAETELISRTKRARRGAHGRIECHSDCPLPSIAELEARNRRGKVKPGKEVCLLFPALVVGR